MSALSKLAALNALRPGSKSTKAAASAPEESKNDSEFYQDDGVTAEDRVDPFGVSVMGGTASRLEQAAKEDDASVTVTKAVTEEEEFFEEPDDDDDCYEDQDDDESCVLDTMTVYEVDVDAKEVASFQEVAKAIRTIVNNSELVLSVLDKVAGLDG